MRKFLLYIFLLFVPLFAMAQQSLSLEIDQASLSPIHKDALTGVAIDKIEPDYSKRPCARIKLHINRMSREDINGISVKVIGGNVVVMKRLVAAEGNGLIVELTAKPETRFYLHHDKYGDSNQVNLNLEGDKEYRLNAQLKQLQSIVVRSNVAGAEVYIDDVFKGRTKDDLSLSINDMMYGKHKLRIENGDKKRELIIDISPQNFYFEAHFNYVQSKPQYVVFKVQPEGATVTIDGRVLPPYRGEYITTLENGTYAYSVTANEYRPEEGEIIVSDNEVRKSISLRPAFGWLKVVDKGALGGAKVYLNDKYLGIAPLTTDKLPSGTYGVKIVKEYYHNYEAEIEIKDNETLNYAPQLAPNFANVSLKVDEGSSIYVNGTYKGETEWHGKLLSGTYTFESRKANHYPSSIRREITPEPSSQSYTLPTPTPILGKINIASKPSSAEVYIDGKLEGETPFEKDIIIGAHEIVVSKTAFDEEKFNINIEEGKTQFLTPQLLPNAATVTVNVDGDFDIYIDNEFKAKGSWNGALKTGEHTFEARKDGYRTTSITERIVSIPSEHTFNLETPTPMYGKLKVSSYPLGTRVYIDDKFVGRTPMKKQLLVGDYKLAIDGCYYTPKTISIIEGKSIKQSAYVSDWERFNLGVHVDFMPWSYDASYWGISLGAGITWRLFSYDSLLVPTLGVRYFCDFSYDQISHYIGFPIVVNLNLIGWGLELDCSVYSGIGIEPMLIKGDYWDYEGRPWFEWNLIVNIFGMGCRHHDGHMYLGYLINDGSFGFGLRYTYYF